MNILGKLKEKPVFPTEILAIKSPTFYDLMRLTSHAIEHPAPLPDGGVVTIPAVWALKAKVVAIFAKLFGLKKYSVAASNAKGLIVAAKGKGTVAAAGKAGTLKMSALHGPATFKALAADAVIKYNLKGEIARFAAEHLIKAQVEEKVIAKVLKESRQFWHHINLNDNTFQAFKRMMGIGPLYNDLLEIGLKNRDMYRHFAEIKTNTALMAKIKGVNFDLTKITNDELKMLSSQTPEVYQSLLNAKTKYPDVMPKLLALFDQKPQILYDIIDAQEKGELIKFASTALQSYAEMHHNLNPILKTTKLLSVKNILTANDYKTGIFDMLETIADADNQKLAAEILKTARIGYSSQ